MQQCIHDGFVRDAKGREEQEAVRKGEGGRKASGRMDTGREGGDKVSITTTRGVFSSAQENSPIFLRLVRDVDASTS